MQLFIRRKESFITAPDDKQHRCRKGVLAWGFLYTHVFNCNEIMLKLYDKNLILCLAAGMSCFQSRNLALENRNFMF